MSYPPCAAFSCGEMPAAHPAHGPNPKGKTLMHAYRPQRPVLADLIAAASRGTEPDVIQMTPAEAFLRIVGWLGRNYGDNFSLFVGKKNGEWVANVAALDVGLSISGGSNESLAHLFGKLSDALEKRQP